MVITSERPKKDRRRYGSAQFRYAVIYILITFVVLLFLNIYCSRTSQEILYKGKEAAMLERCLLISSEISDLEVLNTDNLGPVIEQLHSSLEDEFKDSHLLVTDSTGIVLFDSRENTPLLNQYALFPEIVKALDLFDIFTWQYHDGSMFSRAATPILSYGKLTGCVYIAESDPEQGALIQNLQRNVFFITALLEIAVIIFSVVFTSAFSSRIRKIRSSMQIIRNGDYTHKLVMGGHDELTLLGNEFNDMTEMLHISEAKRHRFVSDASHELKTPLASIKLLSDSILQNEMDMQTIREFVNDIGNEADRLNRMSTKLLSLSKIESQSDGDCEIVNITPTLDRVVKMLRTLAAKENISLHTNVVQDSTILVFEDDLYQILFNLVENSIKYNVPGGSVTISLSQQEDNAVIRVTDTGVGIPEDSLGHLFERFYRVDKARSRKSGGSGLGLAIVRNMVERNTGSISVQSDLGKGTTFTVTFPIFDVETTGEPQEESV